MEFHSFYPSQRLLMGPGPSNIHPRVIEAMGRPTVGHLDPEFVGLMENTKRLLRWALKTQNELTFAVSGPGSLGMECCFANLVEPGDTVLVCQNGVFGKRMEDNVRRFQGEVITIENEWGRAVDPEALEKRLKLHPEVSVVAFVHAETSTGALSDAKTLCDIIHRHGAISVVDAVTSFAGIPLHVDDWKIDALYTGTQKCLSAPPGLSPVTFSQKAVDKVKARKQKVSSWFLDLNLVMGYWSGEGQRTYHHTAPVHSLYALHEALILLYEEGLENSWKRHHDMHLRLKEGLLNLELDFFVPENERLYQLNAVTTPKQVSEANVRRYLLDEFGIEIGAGLGEMSGKIWRIGLMGESARMKNVELLLRALDIGIKKASS